MQEPAVRLDPAPGARDNGSGARAIRRKRVSKLERAAYALSALDAWIRLGADGAPTLDQPDGREMDAGTAGHRHD
jgi:hypothetical protein